jgi:PAS domain-containing protein
VRSLQAKSAAKTGPIVRYDAAFLNADAPIAVLDVNGQFLDCNTAFSALSGYRRYVTVSAYWHCSYSCNAGKMCREFLSFG